MKKLTLALSILAMLLTACGGLVGRSVRGEESNVEGGTPETVKKNLSMFYPIEGTHYQLANISAGQVSESSRSSSYDFSQVFSSGRSDYGVYNYVFFDVESESVYALLPTNENMITSIQGYPMPNSTVTPKVSLAWWLYTLVKKDTNQDGMLSALDKKTLAISDVGGKGYTELVSGVDQILGDVYKDGDILLLIYRASNKKFLAHIDLVSRKVSKTSELPSFGADVK